MKLRDGSHVEDHRLDRLIQFDERSRAFPIAEVVPEDVKTKTWSLSTRLNQDDPDYYVASGCVGHGFSHDAAAAPARVSHVDHSFALRWYYEAQKLDPWSGGAWPGATPREAGTSVLAGAQVGKRDGYFKEYRWAFSIDDVLRAVSHEGPVIVGTYWHDDMWETRPSGLIDSVTGTNVGGHCYIVRGVALRPRLKGESRLGPLLHLTNSWGKEWGKGGDFYLRPEDLEALLQDDGEACVPVRRTVPHVAGIGVAAAKATGTALRAEVDSWHRSFVISKPWRRARR